MGQKGWAQCELAANFRVADSYRSGRGSACGAGFQSGWCSISSSG